MNQTSKNSFSWSFSRYNLYKFCERAYYLHYYGSWNGWDTYAPELTKDVFRLKHLISKKLWLNIILKKSLLNAINNKSYSNNTLATEFKDQTYKVLSSDINSISLEEWKNDPKKICIDELYYKENSIEDVIKWIRHEATEKIKIFQESKLLCKLSNLPYPAFSNTSSPLSFTINNIKVWCSPDLTWNYHGKINFLNLNNSNGWSFLAGLNMLYAEQCHKNYIPSNTVCHTVFFNKNGCYTVYGICSPKEISNIITDSSEEMRSRLTHNQKAYIENFCKTTEQKKCQVCRFKVICLENP
jgi:hypothetical protein